MALPIPPVPPREDLLKLAQAALSNAGDLLADARLLAEAGSSPRAHALATLACEELGKAHQCVRAVWRLSASTPKAFWDGFNNHAGKLWHTQTFSVLESGEAISSSHVFNERIRQGARSAHRRKLRGLYVDYTDGAPQLPCEITEDETWELIERAQTALDRTKASWAEHVRQAELWSQLPEIARVIWIMFLAWAVDTEIDTVIAAIRDGWSTPVFVDLLRRFEQHFRSSMAPPSSGTPSLLPTTRLQRSWT